MSTNSRIGIQNQDGTISSIYCHWDGCPEHNGDILFTHYKDRNKVQTLIDLGSISSLNSEVLAKEGIHTYDNPQDNVTVAYHRDRGEDYDAPRLDIDKDAYSKSELYAYGYLYTLENEWLIITPYGYEILDADEKLVREYKEGDMFSLEEILKKVV